MVVESFSSELEDFLSVKRGQLVEVYDQSGSNWLVCTIPTPGELETEGFLPARCLKPAGQGEGYALFVSTKSLILAKLSHCAICLYLRVVLY